MSFAAAIRSVLGQYAAFSGRARRSEFWWWFLVTCLLDLVASVIDGGYDRFGPATAVVLLATLVPSLAVGARRLHDTGRSGWWQLLALLPVVGLVVLIVWWVRDGDPGRNRFGSSPKVPVEPATWAAQPQPPRS